MKKGIIIDTNEDLIDFDAYRSNSCRVQESRSLFPKNFVPKLKPKIDLVDPSPMILDKRLGFEIEEDFFLEVSLKE